MTPKNQSSLSWRESVRIHWIEALFGAGLMTVSVVLLGSVLPVLLLAVPALSAIFLARIHHRD